MIKRKTKKQAEKIIEQAIVDFGLSQEMKTDPRIIQDILKEMRFDDFQTKFFPVKKFFDEATSQPQRLESMFGCIKQGIISKHPAIVEFLEMGLKKKWFNKSENIVYAVHVMFILEALTMAMCNSHKFFIEIQDYYREKEADYGIKSKYFIRTFANSLRIFRNLFETIKYFSIDPAMIYFRIQRGFDRTELKDDRAKKLLKDKKINYIEYKLLKTINRNGLVYANELLRINIYEAGVAEYARGLKINAICAHELSEDIKNNPPMTMFKKKPVVPESDADVSYDLIVQEENVFPVSEFSQGWVSLYVTWNSAFILGNLDDLDIIFPTLLIPSVINAESENFLGARTISLWLIAKNVFFRKYDKRIVIGPKKKNEMAEAWARINKKYAFDLAKRETHEDSRELKKSYDRFFSQPVYNLCRLMVCFLK